MFFYASFLVCKLKSRVAPYSITSVGHGADPGFLAVGPYVTFVINQEVDFHQARSYFSSQAAPLPLGRYQINYTAWRQRHTGVYSLPEVTARWCPAMYTLVAICQLHFIRI